MNVFVVIVTFNAMHRQWIDRCMRSLAESSVPVTPVIVDNGSQDGTCNHVPDRYPDAVWLPQQKNLGFGQANNVGIRYALEHAADYVMLLNQDAALGPTAVEEMLKVSDGKSLYTPVHLNGDATSFDFMFRSALLKVPGRFVDDLYLGRDLQPSYQVGEICAACWFLPVQLIKQIGGFNPLFFHYGEDNNYYQRLVFHHVSVFLVPQARMMHDRQVHGNEQAFNKNHMRRDLLNLFCDINKSMCRRSLGALKFFVKLPPSAWLQFFLDMMWLLGHCCEIASSRKREKTNGLNWLQ